MRLREIARLCGASELLPIEVAELEPTGICLDSRALRPGELFVAIPGERVDGHHFVEDALGRGACAAIVVHHRLPFATALGGRVDRLIFVESTRCALQQLAAQVLTRWGRPVVGITGSAGKTTMKDLTAHLLEERGQVLKSPGNLNTGYGLALTISRMIEQGASPEDYVLAVIEMGMSSYGEIARLTDLARPEVGVVGNVGTAHLEFFGTQEGIARAKAEMVDGVRPGGTMVLNADDPRVLAMAARRSDLTLLTFAIDGEATVTARDLRPSTDLDGTSFRLRTPQGECLARLPLIGRHNVANALAAAAVAHHFGMAPDRIAARLSTARPSARRGEVVRLSAAMTLIDDTYNSNPPALLEAVRALVQNPTGEEPLGQPRRRVVVAGEMLELGAGAEDLHRQCGRQLAALGVDLLIGVRGHAAALVEGYAAEAGDNRHRAVFCATNDEAVSWLRESMAPGDLILVKGSRGVRMERIVDQLKSIFDPAELAGR